MAEQTTKTATPNAMSTPATSSTITVGRAKELVEAAYPKLFTRFNFAFNGHEDSEPLSEVVSLIISDVRGWLQSMPDNFKSSNHALSRPKYGLSYVLRLDEVRADMGIEFCDKAVDIVEAGWEECKRDLVILKEDGSAPPLENSEELRVKVDELTARNEMLSSALTAMLAKHYDSDVASLFQSLLQLTAP
jgi:hypothetical protein